MPHVDGIQGMGIHALAMVLLVGCGPHAQPFEGEDTDTDAGSDTTTITTTTTTGDTSDTTSTTRPPSLDTTQGPDIDTGSDTEDFPLPPVCGEDFDCDGIPDGFDPFPEDPGLPDRIVGELVMANTAERIFVFDAAALELAGTSPLLLGDTEVRISDLAIDGFGVLYVLTTSDLLVCSAQTLTCAKLGPAAGFNAAGFLDGELWLASASGELAIVRDYAHDPIVEVVGFVPPPFRSSGDLVGLQGIIVLSSRMPDGDGETLIGIDSQTFSLIVDPEAVRRIDGLGIGGLALRPGTDLEELIMFDESGTLFVMATGGTVSVVGQHDAVFIGASSFDPNGGL